MHLKSFDVTLSGLQVVIAFDNRETAIGRIDSGTVFRPRIVAGHSKGVWKHGQSRLSA
jgi:hypothetical protein